jgi:hypothetical protein
MYDFDFNKTEEEEVEDHYADDGYDGTVRDDEWHLDSITGEWCHSSRREQLEAAEVAKELAPLYRVAKWSIVVGVVSSLSMFTIIILGG